MARELPVPAELTGQTASSAQLLPPVVVLAVVARAALAVARAAAQAAESAFLVVAQEPLAKAIAAAIAQPQVIIRAAVAATVARVRPLSMTPTRALAAPAVHHLFLGLPLVTPAVAAEVASLRLQAAAVEAVAGELQAPTETPERRTLVAAAVVADKTPHRAEQEVLAL